MFHLVYILWALASDVLYLTSSLNVEVLFSVECLCIIVIEKILGQIFEISKVLPDEMEIRKKYRKQVHVFSFRRSIQNVVRCVF